MLGFINRNCCLIHTQNLRSYMNGYAVFNHGLVNKGDTVFILRTLTIEESELALVHHSRLAIFAWLFLRDIEFENS